ncbi:MAG: Cdc6/Cdc18 family protein [Candidatus Hodarchaeales archaeon]
MADAFERGLYSGSVFRDGGERTLSPSFVPDALKFRDPTLHSIAQNFRPLFRSDPQGWQVEPFSTNIAVTGPAGVGKTAVIRYSGGRIAKAAEKANFRVYVYYRNCWSTRSRIAIIRSLLRDEFDVSSRGFSEEEATHILMTRLKSEEAHLVMILDEASILPRQDLQGFLLMEEEFGGKHRVSLIMASRPSEWKYVVSPGMAQRINDLIEMNPYSLDEMTEILQYRANLAFRDGCITPDIVEMVAEIAQETLNLRHGIEILYRAGMSADLHEMDEINAELIREAKAAVYPELRSEMLEELKPHELLALLGVARRLVHKNETATSIVHGYKYYRGVCEEWGEVPRGESSFRNFAENLEAVGLIGKVEYGPSGKRSRGRRSRVTIHEIPALLLVERIESLLASRKEKKSNQKTSD